jgi:hypothetical protein
MMMDILSPKPRSPQPRWSAGLTHTPSRTYPAKYVQQVEKFENRLLADQSSVFARSKMTSPFIATAEETLKIKGSAYVLGEGGGYALTKYGQFIANSDPELIRVGSFIVRSGGALQGASALGLKALGIAGTTASLGATAADAANSLRASYACQDSL